MLPFKPYDKAEFLTVVSNPLKKQEHVDDDLASYIAERVWLLPRRFPDPRQAVRIARLAGTREEVDKVLEVVGKYSDTRGGALL